jgi:hypothetical protein
VDDFKIHAPTKGKLIQALNAFMDQLLRLGYICQKRGGPTSPTRGVCMASGASRVRAWAVVNVCAVTPHSINAALLPPVFRWTGNCSFHVERLTIWDVFRWASHFEVGSPLVAAYAFPELG